MCDEFRKIESGEYLKWMLSGNSVYKKDALDQFHEYRYCPTSKVLCKVDNNFEFAYIHYTGLGLSVSSKDIFAKKVDYANYVNGGRVYELIR